MRPPRFEFSASGGRASWWTLLLLAMGLAVWVLAGWRIALWQVHHAQVRSEAATLQAATRARSSRGAVLPPRFTLAAARVRALNQAITSLNTPWDRFFATVETLPVQPVALLALEPDGTRRSVRIIAEAADAQSMLAFVQRLSEEQAFGAATTLVKHEVNEQDPERPYRFEVNARWGDGL